MKKYTLLFISFSIIVLSCTKEMEESTLENQESTPNVECISGRLQFSSEIDLSNFIDAVDNGEAVTENILQTKSANDEFVSLYDFEVKQFMSQFDESTLAEIERRGLIYEPEDSIILSPSVSKVLNSDREVCVKNTVYRYVDNGLVSYPIDNDTAFLQEQQFDQYNNLSDGQTVQLDNGAQFTRIQKPLSPAPSNSNGGGNNSPSQTTPTYSSVMDGHLLKNGTVVPKSNIVKYEYCEGGGDANKFQKWISSLCGINVTAHNYFDDKHRMVLRVFSEHLIIWQGTGMTVRMQEKFLGIWWRKKAQEFRYGWLGPLCHYTYTGPTNVGTLMAIEKNVPKSYYSKPIVLFKVPILDLKELSISNQDIEKALYSWFEKNQSSVSKIINQNNEYADHPKGLFSTDGSNDMYYLFPSKDEIIEYNIGRDIVRWDNDFMVGVSVGFNLNSGTISSVSPFIPSVKSIEIKRIFSYAAVKYNNEWRLCIIYS